MLRSRTTARVEGGLQGGRSNPWPETDARASFEPAALQTSRRSAHRCATASRSGRHGRQKWTPPSSTEPARRAHDRSAARGRPRIRRCATFSKPSLRSARSARITDWRAAPTPDAISAGLRPCCGSRARRVRLRPSNSIPGLTSIATANRAHPLVGQPSGRPCQRLTQSFRIASE